MDKKILIITVIIGLIGVVILLSSCGTHPEIITRNIEIEGRIFADDCDHGHAPKCIPYYYIEGYNLQYDNMDEIMKYNNKSVVITGDLISSVRVYSCKDEYFDGSQHPVNRYCIDKEVKYYSTQNTIRIKSIELQMD